MSMWSEAARFCYFMFEVGMQNLDILHEERERAAMAEEDVKSHRWRSAAKRPVVADDAAGEERLWHPRTATPRHTETPSP